MSAISIVLTKLKATAAVVAKVPKANMHPIMWPQTAQPPALVVNSVGGRDEQVLEGAAGYYEGRVRIESMAITGNDAVAIGEAVKAALESVVKAAIGGFVDVDIFYLTDFTDWADDRSMARVSADYSVRYRAAA